MGGNVIGNRTRAFAYTFRANENEKNLIDKAISASGLTMREFVIRAIINKPVIVIERGGEILAELKRQGNNRKRQRLNFAAECAGGGFDAASEECRMDERRARDEAERRRRAVDERYERGQHKTTDNRLIGRVLSVIG